MLQRQQRGSFRQVRNALAATEHGRDVLRQLGYRIVLDTKTLEERVARVRS